jgi:P4 family phage/plasmid primase-like protien
VIRFAPELVRFVFPDRLVLGRRWANSDVTTQEGEHVTYDGVSNFALSPENDDVLAQALKLVEAGIPVFPTHGLREDGRCTCGNDSEDHRTNRGKHPAVAHGHNDATLDQAQVIQWFGAERGWNLAIPGGPASRLVFIDADVASGGLETLDQWYELGLPDLPQTLRCRTGGGGLHIIYRLPDAAPRLKSGRIVTGVDVKCDGGYVVTAPSRHRSGKRYHWMESDVPVATAPDELVAWLLTTPRIKAGGGGGSGSSAGGHDIPDYDFATALRDGCPAGMRDEFFNELAFRARKIHHLEESQALELIRREWERVDQGDSPFTWSEAAAKVRNVYAKAHLAPDVVVDPRLTAIAAKFTAQAGSQEPADSAPAPQAVAVTGQEEVAESTAGVGSSGQAGGDVPVGGGSGPAVLGQPPELETELTQTGNAHRFVKIFQDHVRFVHGLGWHVWDGTRWKPDEKDDTFELTLGVLEALRLEQAAAAGDDARQAAIGRWRDTSSAMAGRAAMLTGAATDRRVKTVVDEMNTDPWLLVVKNGTVDLRTGKLRPSRPEDNNTRCADVTYDPNAGCPEWLEHIKLVTSRRRPDGTLVADPELARFVQRWIGYTLTGSTDEQKLFFGFGKGNNGKNVLIETVLDLMGDYAIKQSPKLVLGDGNEHSTIIADLAGVRMVFIDETPKGKVNDSRLKELTGSKKIRARKIAQDSFEFKVKFKLWLAGNNKPRVTDTTEGFWRRLDLVPFDAEIPPERRVKDYGKVLQAEWSGILNWALEGLKSYLELGGVGAPNRVRDAVTEYREQENVFGQFVEDTFVAGTTGAWYPTKFLRRVYELWCADEGVTHPLGAQHMAQELRQAGFSSTDPMIPDDKGNGKKVVWTYLNTVKTERGWYGPRVRDDLAVPQDIAWARQGAVTEVRDL